MLVLSRKVEQAVVIPAQGITFRVLEILGDRVRLGIDAPSEVAVHRSEVWDLMQRSGRAVSRSALPSHAEVDALRHELETVSALADLGVESEVASRETQRNWQSVRDAADRCRAILSRWAGASRAGVDGDIAGASLPKPIATRIDTVEEPAQRTVLVVEDHDGHRVQVAAWLRESGHRVIAAKDVDQALDYLWRYRSGINLVVTGWLTAEPGARGLLNRLQAEASPVPLVLLCGDLDGEALVRLQEEGFAAVATRPATRIELDTCLRRVFDGRRTANESVPT